MEKYYVEHYGQLVGKKVVGLVEDPEDEMDLVGLKFDDGTVAWILQDPEGNGPGFLEIVKKG